VSRVERVLVAHARGIVHGEMPPRRIPHVTRIPHWGYLGDLLSPPTLPLRWPLMRMGWWCVWPLGLWGQRRQCDLDGQWHRARRRPATTSRTCGLSHDDRRRGLHGNVYQVLLPAPCANRAVGRATAVRCEGGGENGGGGARRPASSPSCTW